MRIGAHFFPERMPLFLESVRRAEAEGYGRLWLVEGQVLWEDVYVYMTHALAATERVPVGVAITNPVTRHVTVTASAIATLSRLHPGRVMLGLGRGDNAVRTVGLRPASLRELGEAARQLRALVAGREVEAESARLHIRWANADVPLALAATGPRTLRLVGAIADIAMLQVGVNQAAVQWAVEHVRDGAREVGRDPASVEIAAICAVHVGEDVRAGLDACRWAAAVGANQADFVMRANPSHGLPEPLTRAVGARRYEDYNYETGHLDSGAAHARALPDEVIEDFAIVGPPERCLQRIRELATLGVGELSTAYLNGAFEQMERVGTELVPEIATF